MAKRQERQLDPVRSDGASRAVVFIHGFSGNKNDTWDLFPSLLAANVADLDIYTLGYATTMVPDVAGVWSADPDLPILATMLRTQLGIDPLNEYDALALVAHSMGGLIVQKALVDDVELAKRTRQVVLFGTPSGGLRKARLLRFLKPQLENMVEGGEFITSLRARWTERFEPEPGFELRVVAGTKDQFVPPASSLEPFAERFHWVVPGDHLRIVKPEDETTASFRLLATMLASQEDGAPVEEMTRDPLKLASEQPPEDVDVVAVAEHEAEKQPGGLTEDQVVDLALGLERKGRRAESIELLEAHTELGPDVLGTLGGRVKRIWLETEEEGDARRAYELYERGLALARELLAIAKADEELDRAHGQMYYHAINLAFLHFVAFDEPDVAVEMANLAIEHATARKESVWSVATVAEAHLYKGDTERALREYERMLSTQKGEEWQHLSTGQQATLVAAKLRDESLAERIAELFSPQSRKTTKIFVSYSHLDQPWVDRFRRHAKPWLRKHEELDLWVDTRIEAGDQWHPEIQAALGEAGVAVAFVSANFLGSDYILDNELPEILKAAEDGDLTLVWAYLSHGALDATDLPRYQAAHDTNRPLAELPGPEQERVLADLVRQMKEAALRATGTYTSS